MKGKKSQALSLDMISAFVIFVLLISLLVAFLVLSNIFDPPKTYDFELEYVFKNIEKNTKTLTNGEFIDGSKINILKLESFASSYDDKSIDNIILGNLSSTQGIGLDPSAYDTCLYFTDNDNTHYEMTSGIKHIGRTNNGKCDTEIRNSRNPCKGYSDAISLMKPVLLEFGDYSKNRIVQMNVVVCVI
jgi:hypothetical protein